MDKSINVARAAVIAGLVAGTIDIGAAALINHVCPMLILQGIASTLRRSQISETCAGLGPNAESGTTIRFITTNTPRPNARPARTGRARSHASRVAAAA